MRTSFNSGPALAAAASFSLGFNDARTVLAAIANARLSEIPACLYADMMMRRVVGFDTFCALESLAGGRKSVVVQHDKFLSSLIKRIW